LHGEEYTKGQYTLAAALHRWLHLAEASTLTAFGSSRAAKLEEDVPWKISVPHSLALGAAAAALMVQWNWK